MGTSEYLTLLSRWFLFLLVPAAMFILRCSGQERFFRLYMIMHPLMRQVGGNFFLTIGTGSSTTLHSVAVSDVGLIVEVLVVAEAELVVSW